MSSDRRIPPAGDPFCAAARARDELEACYSGLDRMCGCYDGYHYLGHMVEDPETGEEVEEYVRVACKRCKST